MSDTPNQHDIDRLLADLPEDARDAARAPLEALARRAASIQPSPASVERARDLLRSAVARKIDASPLPAPTHTFFMKHLISGALGFAAALLAIGGYVAIKPSALAPDRTLLALRTDEVRKLGDRAYDATLKQVAQAGVTGSMAESDAPRDTARSADGAALEPMAAAPEGVPAPDAPGGALSASAVPAPTAAPPGMGGSTDAFIGTEEKIGMPAPSYAPPYVDYALEADVPALASMLPVFRVESEEQGSAVRGSVASTLRMIGGKIVDETQVLQRFTLSENRERGYVFEFDLQGGMMNCYRDWTRWPNADGVPATPSAIEALSDEKAIATAKAFAERYGIDTSRLDAPVIDTSWVRYAPAEAALSSAWPVPSKTVLFGRSFDSYPLRTWDGSTDGALRITISATDGEVEMASGLLAIPLSSSNYPTLSARDVEREARRGGMTPPFWGPMLGSAEQRRDADTRGVMKVTLDRVEIGYLQKQVTEPGSGMSTYLIPVYFFQGTMESRGTTDYYGSGEPQPATVLVPAVEGAFFTEEEKNRENMEAEFRFEAGNPDNAAVERFAQAYVFALLSRDTKAALAALTPEGKRALVAAVGTAEDAAADMEALEADGRLAELLERALEPMVSTYSNDELSSSASDMQTRRDGATATVRVNVYPSATWIPQASVIVEGANAPFRTSTWNPFPAYMPYAKAESAPAAG